MMRVLVTGSRAWPDVHEVRRVLDELLARVGPFILVQGGAVGADRMAKNWALSCSHAGVLMEQWDADWPTCSGPKCTPGHRKQRRDGTWYCPTAGHHRNALMVESDPDLVIAFHADNSRGTVNCIEHAERLGVPVARYTPDGGGSR